MRSVRAVVVAIVAALASAVLAAAAAAAVAPRVAVLSNRADLVSGGDALVRIALPATTRTRNGGGAARR